MPLTCSTCATCRSFLADEQTIKAVGEFYELDPGGCNALWNHVRSVQANARAEKQRPMPRWVHKAREGLGRKMYQHVNDDGSRWDVCTLASVMRAHLPCFVKKIGCGEFRAKELLEGLLQTAEGRHRRAHAQQPTEAEVLDSLRHMVGVLRQCACDETEEMQALLRDAQDLVDNARLSGGTLATTRKLSVKEFQALHLYRALIQFEAKIILLVAGFEYRDGTIVFPPWLRTQQWDTAQEQLIKSLSKQFKDITVARKWLFHDNNAHLSVAAVLNTMGAILEAVADFKRNSTESHDPTTWRWGSELQEQTRNDVGVVVSIKLCITGHAMSIPVSRDRCMVGRSSEIQEATAALLTRSGARVLISGVPGVGKDSVAVEIVVQDDFKNCKDIMLQAWLPGSTDDMLRRQLVQVFATHRREVIQGCENEQAEALARIRAWLAVNDSWLFVIEDATWECKALWDCFPKNTGRLLITSQDPLQIRREGYGELGITKFIELEPLKSQDCIELWRKMKLFSKPPQREIEPTDSELQALCAATGGGVLHVPPPATESGRARKQRTRQLLLALHAHEQLSQPELMTFFQEQLGNLPLSVRLCGHMFRVDDSLQNITGIIALFNSVQLDEVDLKGRDKKTDTHYFGLARSIAVAIERMLSSAQHAAEDKQAAVTLLCGLSLLPPSATPTSLFKLEKKVWDSIFLVADAEKKAPKTKRKVLLRKKSGELLFGTREKFATDCCHIFDGSSSRFETARGLLIQFGLLKAPQGKGEFVGKMHQLVQRCVRQLMPKDVGRAWLKESPDEVVFALRSVLMQRYNVSLEPSAWPRLRRLTPCVDTFCHTLIDEAKGGRMSVTPFDTELLGRLGQMLLHVEGNALTAEPILRRAVDWSSDQRAETDSVALVVKQNDLATALNQLGLYEQAIQLLGQVIKQAGTLDGEPQVQQVSSMSILATAYRRVGRLERAVEMHEQCLFLRKKLLPAESPDLISSINNLACAYSEMGRTEEAVALLEDALAIRRRSLPEDHPNVFTLMGNLAVEYRHLGQYSRAVGIHSKVLEYRKRVLPEDHPDIGAAMNNLAASYRHYGQMDKAADIFKEALEFHLRVLPPDHPDISTSQHNLASIYGKQGRFEDAVRMQEQALKESKRVLNSDHPHIGTGTNNLASAYAECGRFEEAMSLYEEALLFRKRVLPSSHPDIAKSQGNLAAMYSDCGRHEEANTLFKDCLANLLMSHSAEHPDVAAAMDNCGSSLARLGRHQEAVVLFEKVLATRAAILPAGHDDLVTTRNNLANALQNLGRLEEATAMFEALLAAFELDGKPSTGHFKTLCNYAAVLQASGRDQQAIPVLQKACDLSKGLLPPQHPDIASCLSNLAVAYFKNAQYDEAVPLLEEGLAINKLKLPAHHEIIGDTMNTLGCVYLASKRHAEAIATLTEAVEFRQTNLPAGHPDITSAMNNRARAYGFAGRYEDARDDLLAVLKHVGSFPDNHPSNVAAIVQSSLNAVQDMMQAGQQPAR